jgi:bifunctional DNA-binding transcriptional regulator/antitoxin component of YhaV-PrlF toxin-antitoxin module
MGKRGHSNVTKHDTLNISFTTTLDERGRVTIPKVVRDLAKTKKDDKVTLVLTEVRREEVTP